MRKEARDDSTDLRHRIAKSDTLASHQAERYAEMMILPQLDSNKGFAIGARWVYPVSAPAIRDGAVVIQGKQILAVGARDAILAAYKDWSFIDYGQAIITPGLINLHSHLDYSALRHLNAEESLFNWIPLLMKSVASWAPSDFLASATYGAQSAALTGTTFIVDSSYSGSSAEAIAATGLKGLVGLELFGLDKEIADPVWKNWVARLEKLVCECPPVLKNAIDEGKITFTCSPHAPYTVSPSLWRLAKNWADSKGLPLLSHLAESEPESAWVRDTDLLINSFLMKVSPSNKDRDTESVLKAIDWKQGLSPVGHLEKHGLLSDKLVAAHCVQVDADDIALLKAGGVSVAHCPRSNARLRNGRAPLNQLLAAGINIGLGTDSLASTDDLNPLAEANFAINLHRAVEPHCQLSSHDLIMMLTLSAARAIGLEAKLGSLETGKAADISVFLLANHPAGAESTNPADLLVRSPTRTQDVFVDGERVVESGCLKNFGR